MDKYIFQSKSDRDILDSSDDSGENGALIKLSNLLIQTQKSKNADEDSPSKVESIIDFSTFLLHCYKL